MRIDISAIAADFPRFAAAIILCEKLSVTAERSASLAEIIANAERDTRERWAGTELSAIPGIAAWRRAYRQFGIRKTSYRSSVERLVKNVLAGQSLPAVNGFVDAYNAISLRHVLPSGADDLDRIVGDLAYRYARDGDNFLDMGARDDQGRPNPDPPKPGEVVYADREKVLCRRWNWRQDARSAIHAHTIRAVVTLQSNGEGDLRRAATELVDLLSAECGGVHAVTFIDAAHPVCDLHLPLDDSA